MYANKIHLYKRAEFHNRNEVIGFYKNIYKDRDNCILILGENSLITHKHMIDITDIVTIDNNVVLGGRPSELWTHGFDIYRNMITGPITIGNDIYIGSRCTIYQNVYIHDNVVVGASTCVSKNINEKGFYVSNQLLRKGDVKKYKQY